MTLGSSRCLCLGFRDTWDLYDVCLRISRNGPAAFLFLVLELIVHPFYIFALGPTSGDRDIASFQPVMGDAASVHTHTHPHELLFTLHTATEATVLVASRLPGLSAWFHSMIGRWIPVCVTCETWWLTQHFVQSVEPRELGYPSTRIVFKPQQDAPSSLSIAHGRAFNRQAIDPSKSGLRVNHVWKAGRILC